MLSEKITKRKFLHISGSAGVLAMGAMFFGCSDISVILRKIRSRFIKPSVVLPDEKRKEFALPGEAESISVEKALNSRCSSDYDNDQGVFHWGMFDPAQKLSLAQLKKLLDYSFLPRFTDVSLPVSIDKSILSFHVDGSVSDIKREWAMVESGMQQQAIVLACTALGIGNVYVNNGKDGSEENDGRYVAVKLKVDAMKPSYKGSYWTDKSPLKEAQVSGNNLPAPLRDGGKPLLAALKNLTKESIGQDTTKRIDKKGLSQLLWAARGRTPHLYKSTPYGLTIPTWGGEQSISGVHTKLLQNLYSYINQVKSHPAHELKPVQTLTDLQQKQLSDQFPSWNSFIIFYTNENYARALWETGYQLLNVMLQAYSLGISYQAILLDNQQKSVFSSLQINNPVAVVALNFSPGNAPNP